MNKNIMKYLLFLILVNCFLNSNCQKAVLSTTQTRVFYIGIVNPFEIAVPNQSNNILFIKSSDSSACKISKITDIKYNADVFKLGNCKIYLIENQIKVDSFNIQSRYLPKGEIRFGEYRNGSTISKNELLKQNKLNYFTEAYISFLNDIVVQKYQLIVLPKNGIMQSRIIECNNIDSVAKNLIEPLDNGDMIIFEGIRLNYQNKPIPSIVIYINDNKLLQNSSPIRIAGYYRNGTSLNSYIYPSSKFDTKIKENENASKDSIWSYFRYDNYTFKYKLTLKDSFYKCKLILRQYYNDSNEKLDYTLQPLNDSTWNYRSYHSNGKIYQEGAIMYSDYPNEGNPYRSYRKSSYYLSPEFPINGKGFEKFLYDIDNDLRPINNWNVYNQFGQLLYNIPYKDIPDILNPSSLLECEIRTVNYITVIDGNIKVFNPKNGKLKKVISYKKGEISVTKKSKNK
ncbi:MAG: GldM family protein [Bacteroidia bacterium]